MHSWFSLERLKKPVSELLMHTGETYRQIQEERELLDRMLSTRSDGKVRTVHPVGGVWTAGDKKKIYPVHSFVKPSRSLLNSITSSITCHSGTSQINNLACGGPC